jgi:prophage regulatory protein
MRRKHRMTLREPCPICTPQYDALLRPYIQASIQHHLSSSIRLDRRLKEFGMRQQVEPIMKRTIRRHQLREMVPLADTTIYDMEQRGEFPQRFYLTSRCVVWDLSEVEAWLEERRRASRAKAVKRAPIPDVQLRKTRPIKQPARA